MLRRHSANPRPSDEEAAPTGSTDGTGHRRRWALLRDPVLGPLGAALCISAFGSAMVALAVVYISYDRTQSVFRTVLVTTAYALPAAIFGVVAGRLAEHHSRRRILLISYSTKMVLYGLVAVVEFGPGLRPDALVVLSFVAGTVSAFAFPAVQGFDRDLIEPDRLSIANAFFASLNSGAQLVGVAAGGLVLGLLGPGWVFALDALSFVPLLLVVHGLHPEERLADATDRRTHEFRRALRVIRADAGLRRGFASLVAVSLLAAPVVQLLPAVAAEISRRPHTLGFLMAAFALGGIAVTAAMARWGRRRSRLELASIGIVVIAVALVAFGVGNWLFNGEALYLPVIIALVVLGLTISLVDAALAALVQSSAPPEVEGSVYAVYGMVLSTLGPLSALVLARVADLVDVYTVLAVCGGLLLGWGGLRRRRARTPVGEPVGDVPPDGTAPNTTATAGGVPVPHAHPDLLLGLVHGRRHPIGGTGPSAPVAAARPT